MMKKFNEFLRKNLFSLVLTSIVLGFLLGWQFPKFASSLKIFIPPVLFLMIFVMIIPIEFRELVAVRKYGKEILWGCFAILILAPLVAYLINFAFPENYDYLKAGLILAATMPPGGMIVSWTGLLDANVELAMLLQTITFILALLTIPLTLSLFLSKSIHFSQSLLIKNLAFYIFLPLLLGYIVQILLRRKYSKAKINSWKPTLASISALCALLVVFISVSLKATVIIAHPQALLWGLLLAVIYYLIMFLVSLFFSGFLIDSYDNQMPIVYGTTSKNLSIGIALALSTFSGAVVLGVVFCSMIQMPMLSLFYKFIRREEQEFAEEVEEEKRKRHPVSTILRKIRTVGNKSKKSN
jgi:ACR3 family arsenite efflux pump ArsB